MFRKQDVVVTKKIITHVLIEDEQLIKDLVQFCNNRYELECRHINEVKVKDLLKDIYAIKELYKLNKSRNIEDEEYIYEVEYVYQSRWPSDYSTERVPVVRKFSFNEVIQDFINIHPEKCRWQTYEENFILKDY